jgi:hypothetical protein
VSPSVALTRCVASDVTQVKSVIFLTFWQSYMVHFTVCVFAPEDGKCPTDEEPQEKWTVRVDLGCMLSAVIVTCRVCVSLVYSLQDLIMCVEMLGFAIINSIAFSYKGEVFRSCDDHSGAQRRVTGGCLLLRTL